MMETKLRHKTCQKMNTFANDLILELNNIGSSKPTFDLKPNCDCDMTQSQILQHSPADSRTEAREKKPGLQKRRKAKRQIPPYAKFVARRLWFNNKLEVFYVRVPRTRLMYI